MTLVVCCMLYRMEIYMNTTNKVTSLKEAVQITAEEFGYTKQNPRTPKFIELLLLHTITKMDFDEEFANSFVETNGARDYVKNLTKQDLLLEISTDIEELDIMAYAELCTENKTKKMVR